MNGWPNAHFEVNSQPGDPYCNDFHTYGLVKNLSFLVFFHFKVFWGIRSGQRIT